MNETEFYDRWSELSELIEKAGQLPAHEVDAFCLEACGDDAELYRMLCSLLSHVSGDDDQRMRSSIADVASDLSLSEDLIGEQVGPYRIDQMLGRGGMGEVYLASRADGEFEKQVAIKIVRRRLTTESAAASFRNERQIMANLDHVSIPTLVDAGQLEDGRLYFVCDYVDGVAIDVYCTKQNLSTTGELELLHKVGEALQHAHSNLVLHLDIKPENVLVKSDGTPSLLDFGVARMVGQSSEGQRAFSPAYASPEQIRGDALSAASDVYSLGALMFRLLTGTPSFETPSAAPTETVLGERAKFVESLAQPNKRDDLHRDLRAIIRKAMAEKPQARYPTVDALLRDLVRFRNHLPVSARRRTVRYRAGKFLRRYRVAAVAITVAFATLAGFAAREASLRQRAQEAFATTTQVSDYLIGIFKVMDPTEANGSSVTARELLDSATLRVRSDLGNQPVVASRIMYTMGDIYAGLGLYEQATAVMEDARVLGDPQAGGYELSAIRTSLLADLGSNYIRIDRYDDAEQALQSSIELAETVFGSRHESLPLTLSTYGRLHTLRQDYDQALDYLQRAQALAEQVYDENDQRHAAILIDLENYYAAVGDYEEREALLKRVVNIQLVALGPEHIAVANALSKLALYYVESSRPADAIDMLERAHAQALKTLPAEHPTIAAYLYRLGLTYMNLAQYEKAEMYFLSALDRQEEAYGPVHRTVGSTVSYLGSLYNLMGRTQDAESYLIRSLKIMRRVHPENHSSVAYQKLALGEVLRVGGSLREAERYTSEAITTFREIASMSDAIELIDPTAEWQLANILRDQGRHDEALSLYAPLYAWHLENPSPDKEYMLEVATQYRDFLRLTGRNEQAAMVVTPGETH